MELVTHNEPKPTRCYCGRRFATKGAAKKHWKATGHVGTWTPASLDWKARPKAERLAAFEVLPGPDVPDSAFRALDTTDGDTR